MSILISAGIFGFFCGVVVTGWFHKDHSGRAFESGQRLGVELEEERAAAVVGMDVHEYRQLKKRRIS